jgi:hypothetical protein
MSRAWVPGRLNTERREQDGQRKKLNIKNYFWSGYKNNIYGDSWK